MAQLPLRFGGLGLRSATRTALAAYWASWADILPIMKQRCPILAARFLAELESNNGPTSCLMAAKEARSTLERVGYKECPTWLEIWNGVRPEQMTIKDPGEWSYGWQYFAAAHGDQYVRDGVLLPSVSSATAAFL